MSKNIHLSRQQRKELHNALINAFPNKSSLEQMLSFGLDKKLDVIVSPEGSLGDIVFDLIKKAEAENWVDNLVSAALRENPHNKKLKDVAESLSIASLGEEIEKGKAKHFREDLGNGISLDMVYIPGGKFMMGSPSGEGYCREKPQHEVTVSSFYIGRYQVTQAQFRAVASLPQVKRKLEPEASYFKGDNRPVEQVSWYDTVEFCDRLSHVFS